MYANCPICGYILEGKITFRTGDICICCGNESDCDDDLFHDELESLFGEDILNIFYHDYKKYIDSTKFIDKEIAWRLLRAMWVKKRYPIFYDDYRKKLSKKKLSKEKAWKQLENINVNAEELEKKIFQWYKNDK